MALLGEIKKIRNTTRSKMIWPRAKKLALENFFAYQFIYRKGRNILMIDSLEIVNLLSKPKGSPKLDLTVKSK